MSTKLKAWLSAARLRTLPLSLSGIVIGAGLAASKGFFDYKVFVLCLLTTIAYQVLSNFANDYGDGVKGTDNDNRIGPQRTIQSGAISIAQMRIGIAISVVISLLLTIFLIFSAFDSKAVYLMVTFLILGVFSVIAAIKYTVGNNAYGYRGLGDLFVFVFFGLVSVVGSYYILSQSWNWMVFLPAISVGLLSVGVLNLNNMRDIKSDKDSGKITLVVRMGSKSAKYYHYFLISTAMLVIIVSTIFNYRSPFNFLYFPVFIPLMLHLKRVYTNNDPGLLDPELKKLALSTFLFAILYAISINIFL